jgi:hypothetical protein
MPVSIKGSIIFDLPLTIQSGPRQIFPVYDSLTPASNAKSSFSYDVVLDLLDNSKLSYWGYRNEFFEQENENISYLSMRRENKVYIAVCYEKQVTKWMKYKNSVWMQPLQIVQMCHS